MDASVRLQGMGKMAHRMALRHTPRGWFAGSRGLLRLPKSAMPCKTGSSKVSFLEATVIKCETYQKPRLNDPQEGRTPPTLGGGIGAIGAPSRASRFLGYWVAVVEVGAVAVKMRGMKTALAGFAFFLAVIAFLACLAVAFYSYELAPGSLPVLRIGSGLTPVGLLVLIFATPSCLLSLWAGFSLIGRDKNDPPT
jgi:hypothetical protein